MKRCSLYRVELRRLLLSKPARVITALSMCGPLFGYSVYTQSDAAVTTGQYIANPVLAGTVIGAVLWAGLTLLETDKAYRAKTDVLSDAAASPVRMALSRMTALVTLSAAACVICALIYLPYTIIKVESLFTLSLYAGSFFVIMMPTWCISILLASALYQIVRRIELAGLLYAACAYISLSRFVARDLFLRWLNPIVITYSDGFSSLLYLRIALYTRVLWLALAGGLWALSLLCIRRYQKNLAGAFLHGLRKTRLAFVAAPLLAAGSLLWVWQPFVNHGPDDFVHNPPYMEKSAGSISVPEVTYRLTALPRTGCLHGVAEYVLSTYNNEAAPHSIWLDPGYKILRVACNGEKLVFKTLRNDVNDARQTVFTIPPGERQILTIEYKGYPTLMRSFSPHGWGNEITSDYVYLMNASAAPVTSFLRPRSYALELTLPGCQTPVVKHKLLTEHAVNADGTKTWRATVQNSHPYALYFAAADYVAEQVDAAGIPMDFIYSRKYEKIMEKYQIPDAISDVFAYCTEHLGPLSWAGDDSLVMLQRSAAFGSGFAGEGWVELCETVFSPNNLDDPLKGAKATDVLVHEMVHQWWGGLGVYCTSEHDGDGLWSDEGLTVYTTYRLLKDKYGEQYVKKEYIDIWQAAVDIQERGFYYRHPEYLEKLPVLYRVQLSRQTLQTNLYCRMPLMILKAERLVGGEGKMDEILQGVQKERSGNGVAKSFTYQDFLDACGLREEELKLG